VQSTENLSFNLGLLNWLQEGWLDRETNWEVSRVFVIYAWMKASEAMNKPSILGLLMIVPILNFIIPFYLAYR
jgi:hypothetical protein